MKKTILIIISVIVIAGAATFLYFTRPTAGPSQDVTDHGINVPSTTADIYRIDPSESTVTFNIGEVLRGTPFMVVGTTSQIGGDIYITGDKLEIGTIRVNARTFKTDDARRDNAVVNLIIGSNKPENELMTFVPKEMKDFTGSFAKGELVTFNVMGDLTIAGKTKTVTFAGNVRKEGDKLYNGSSVILKRSDFGLVIPSVPFVANVPDEFTVNSVFVAKKVSN